MEPNDKTISDFSGSQKVRDLALAEETCKCLQCKFLHKLACPEDDWENRDPVKEACDCFEEDRIDYGDDCR